MVVGDESWELRLEGLERKK